jgi:hypothetical protein
VRCTPPLGKEECKVLADLVGRNICAATSPPSFNHAVVVAPHPELGLAGSVAKDVMADELKSDSLGPLDAAVFVMPAWEQCPGPPFVANDNTDTCPRACVQISMHITDASWSAEFGFEAVDEELVLPPAEVVG